MKNKWKIIAIIFITLFVIETLYVIYATKIGTEYLDNNNFCAINICSEETGADSFYYEFSTKICYCYKDNEVIKQTYIA